MCLNKTILVFICLVFLFATPVLAQQLNPSETQFFINSYLANPAMAGMKPQELIINSAYRSQWDKVTGSPKTIAFTADYRSPNNVGLGLNFNSADGEKTPVYLGSYGIGVTRLMGVMVEIFSDSKIIIIINTKKKCK